MTNAVGVELSAVVTATFDGEIDETTVTSRTFAILAMQQGLLTGTVGCDGAARTITVTPTRTFFPGKVVRVAATQGISATGGTIVPTQWQFTTGPVLPDRSFAGFTDIGAGLPAVDSSTVAWGDYDGDGDLDLLVAGLDVGFNRVTTLYRSDDRNLTNSGVVLVGISSRLPPTSIGRHSVSRVPPGAWRGAAVLPLDPGERLLLTLRDAHYVADESNTPVVIPTLTQVYAQVDSLNLATTYSGILETYEIAGAAYNNIGGAVTVPATRAQGWSEAHTPSAVTGPEGRPPGAGLPPRPQHPGD